MVLLLVLLILGVAFSQELDLKKVMEDTLSNNLELKALRAEIRALEKEYESAKANLFPRIKLEEKFSRTDIPAYVLFTKLNQERITPNDFTPSNLNDPDAVSNFETTLSVEIPIWMGGKIRAFEKAVHEKKLAYEKMYSRKEEEVLFKAYNAYLSASLSRSALKTARKNIEDAKEHLRIAQKLYEVGMALLSDVLRAKVFLKMAEEKEKEAQENYKTSKRALSLVANADYQSYDVPELGSCPDLSESELLQKAITNREDLKAMENYLKATRAGYRASLSDMLPQIAAFASYQLFDKNTPFGSEGSGYMFGLSVSIRFNTALSELKRAQSYKERERAIESRRKLLKKAILFEVRRAYSEYEVALSNMKSAEERLREAKEVVRILKKRYKSGLARMVDLLDAQTQLERARFDYIQALYKCNLSYGKALLAAGVIKEVLR